MTKLVGILNLAPDSFSGDGLAVRLMLTRIDALMKEGEAFAIDIGAESTRPGAKLLSAEDEWRRLAPLLEGLGPRTGKIYFSLDTRHAENARRALALGFDWINDVSGGHEPAMLEAVKERGAMFVAMHSLGVPADPRRVIPASADAVEVVLQWGVQTLAKLEKAGISPARVILDPGIGFGKTPEQSLAIIKNIGRLKALGATLMVGHSRKSFLSLFTEKKAPLRDPETIVVSQYLAGQGVDYLRVHDVASHAAMLRIKAAL